MVAVSWIVRITPPGEHGPQPQLDSPSIGLTSLLWDLGTTGIAEVDGLLVAGFDSRTEAEHAVAELAALEVGAVDTSQMTIEPVDPTPWRSPVGTAAINWNGERIEFPLTADGVFGHGQHVTTVIALDLLPDALRHRTSQPDTARATAATGPAVPVSTLDIGTGTGVLAIAAAKTGAAAVTAIDIDPLAVACAADNAKATETTITVTDETAESLADGGHRFDLVMANVLLPTHRILADTVVALTDAGGMVLLSGYLIEQIDELLDLYRATAAAVEPIACSYRGQWAGHLLRVTANPAGTASRRAGC